MHKDTIDGEALMQQCHKGGIGDISIGGEQLIQLMFVSDHTHREGEWEGEIVSQVTSLRP